MERLPPRLKKVEVVVSEEGEKLLNGLLPLLRSGARAAALAYVEPDDALNVPGKFRRLLYGDRSKYPFLAHIIETAVDEAIHQMHEANAAKRLHMDSLGLTGDAPDELPESLFPNDEEGGHEA